MNYDIFCLETKKLILKQIMKRACLNNVNKSGAILENYEVLKDVIEFPKSWIFCY